MGYFGGGGGGGVSTGGNNVWTGTNTFIDNLFSILDDGDNTKIAQFNASPITTGTTRTFNMPNLNGALLSAAIGNQAFNGGFLLVANDALRADAGYRFTFGPSFDADIVLSTLQTPDNWMFGVPSQTNCMTVLENSDWGFFDYAIPVQTNPTLVVCSANRNTQERVGVRHNQTQGQLVDLATTAANARPFGFVGGSIVASAATITPTGNTFHVSGTTNIDNVTIMAAGTIITAIFDGVLTVGDAGNLKLSAPLVTTADDTLTLMSDGTNWFEVARSAN